MELLERMREISGGLYISDLCGNFYMTNNQVNELNKLILMIILFMNGMMRRNILVDQIFVFKILMR